MCSNWVGTVATAQALQGPGRWSRIGLWHTLEPLCKNSSEIATLLSNQGAWSEQEYLALDTNRRVEFDSGFVELHDPPTDRHQGIIVYFIVTLTVHARQIGGVVRPSGMRLRLWERKYREPDIVLLCDRDSSLRQENFWDGADLVVEIVSQGREERERDLVTKRIE